MPYALLPSRQSSSFSQAAELLNVTPGAVSRHIRTLEDHFACQLFERNGPKVMLTDAGRMLAVHYNKGFLNWRMPVSNCAAPCAVAAQSPFHADDALATGCDGRFPGAQDAEVEYFQHLDGYRQCRFHQRAFDCAILLGNGHFGAGTRCLHLFDEWLLPICAPDLLDKARIIWRLRAYPPLTRPPGLARWLNRSGLYPG
jgi:DNA-binding transcriptional LysR family regulator